MSDARNALWQQLSDAVLQGPGKLDPAVRQAAAAGKADSEPLAGYVARVTHDAVSVNHADHAALHAAGLSEDQIFEATVAAAVGAGLQRWRAGLAALESKEG